MNPISAKEIYERCPDLPGQAGDVRLRTYEWHFLMALDGRKTVEEIANEVRLDETRLAEVIHRLCESKLMGIPELTWTEFASRYPTASRPALPAPAPVETSPVPLDGHLDLGAFPKNGSGDHTVAEAPGAVSFAINRSTAAKRTVAPAVERTVMPVDAPIESPVAPPPPTHAEPPLNLKQLIDYVTQQAGGGLRGKLAVYRLFLRVPNEQIRAAGIESLNFVDDRFEIRGPAMRAAILDAVTAVTGRPYPLLVAA